MKKVILAVVSLCSAVLMNKLYAQTNLIKNGGFENYNEKQYSTEFNNWSFYEGTGSVFAKSSKNDKEEGNIAAEVPLSQDDAGEDFSFYYYEQIDSFNNNEYPFKIKKGKKYKISFWTKRKDTDKNISYTFHFNKKDENGDKVHLVSQNFSLKPTDTNWVKNEYTFNATDNLDLGFSIEMVKDEDITFTENESILFDDFVLTEEDANLSTSDVLVNKNLLAYPNPTSNLFYIENPKNGANKVEIFNSVGSLVKTQNFSNESRIEISLQSLPKGIYIYKIGSLSDKILKN